MPRAASSFSLASIAADALSSAFASNPAPPSRTSLSACNFKTCTGRPYTCLLPRIMCKHDPVMLLPLLLLLLLLLLLSDSNIAIANTDGCGWCALVILGNGDLWFIPWKCSALDGTFTAQRLFVSFGHCDHRWASGGVKLLRRAVGSISCRSEAAAHARFRHPAPTSSRNPFAGTLYVLMEVDALDKARIAPTSGPNRMHRAFRCESILDRR